MAKDARLDRKLNLIRAQAEAVQVLAGFIASHLNDAQSLAWEQTHPDSNFPAQEEGEQGKFSSADRARALIERLQSKSTGMAHVEDVLTGYAREMAKLFHGAKPDDTHRGTLLGWKDSQGRFVAHSAKLEMADKLRRQAIREARAHRTGETTHKRLEKQPLAPKEPGVDPNLRRPA